LESKIKDQRLKYVEFANVNSFFLSDVDLGFMIDTHNKAITGKFKYRLILPKALNSHDQEFDKLSLIDLKPLRMQPFAESCGFRNAYAPVDSEKVLLISSSHKSKNFLNCELIQTKGQ
jgi:hypothetical protein